MERLWNIHGWVHGKHTNIRNFFANFQILFSHNLNINVFGNLLEITKSFLNILRIITADWNSLKYLAKTFEDKRIKCIHSFPQNSKTRFFINFTIFRFPMKITIVNKLNYVHGNRKKLCKKRH